MRRLPLSVHHCSRSSVARVFCRYDEVDIGFGGGAVGAEVHDGLDGAALALEPRLQCFGRDDVDDLVPGEIAPAFILAQPVDHDHRGAALRQLRHDVRADEAGAAGDDVHGLRREVGRPGSARAAARACG